MINLIAYCSIAGVAVGSYLGLSWTVAVVGAVVLSLISIADNLQYREKLSGAVAILHTANLAGIGSAVLASGTAYACGALMRLMVSG